VLNEDENRRRARESEMISQQQQFLNNPFSSYLPPPAAIYNTPPPGANTVRPQPMYHKVNVMQQQAQQQAQQQMSVQTQQQQPQQSKGQASGQTQPNRDVRSMAGVKRPHEDEQQHYKPNAAVSYTPSVPRTTAPSGYPIYGYPGSPYHHPLVMPPQVNPRPTQRF